MDSGGGLVARENKLAVFENVVPKEKTYTTRRFFGKTYIEDSLSTSESDLVIDEEDRSTRAKRKDKKKQLKLKDEPLDIRCKWFKCKVNFTDYKKFIFHLRDHVQQKYKMTKKKFRCLWGECTHTATSMLYLIQHACYHVYHTRLEHVGENIADRNKLPACSQDYQFEIPFSENGYICEWEHCDANFVTVYDFFEHMAIHWKNNPTYCKNGEIIECGWKNCTNKFKSQYLLRAHIRTHTKEKLVACKNCGKTFATRTKFMDHRKKQLPINLQGYQCSQCSKLFPSERLLRDHMRSHINHYKCSFCDMTCTRPSSLALHIRHRHLDDRPYKCNLCEHACVTKQNLEYHLITHCAEKLLTCDECDFKCRSMPGLDKHYQKAHCPSWVQTYECHCCKRLFSRGAYLTKHLMRVHDFHWPSGHSRFRYKEDPDHIFRLQTVRYESLEVTEQIIKNKTRTSPSTASFKFDLKKKTLGKYERGPEYVLSLTENADDSSHKRSQESNKLNTDILITIDDVDEEGNILKSEVIHAKEMICENETSFEGAILKFEEGKQGVCQNTIETVEDNAVEVYQSDLQMEQDCQMDVKRSVVCEDELEKSIEQDCQMDVKRSVVCDDELEKSIDECVGNENYEVKMDIEESELYEENTEKCTDRPIIKTEDIEENMDADESF